MSEKILKVKPGTFPSVSEIPLGGVLPSSGNGVEYKTGSWRTQRPILNRDVCTDCMLCWMHCPDDSIIVEDSKVVGIDMDHCKGCGICSAECGAKPVKAMTMKQGGRYEEGETFAKHTV